MGIQFKAIAIACSLSGALLSTVQAETREWDPVPVTISRSASDTDYRDLQLKADIYDVWFEKTFQKRTYSEYQCDTDVGDGSDGNWHGYWQATKREKPTALSGAIKGIGYTSAQRIVDSGKYFQRKPRSWNSFKNEIRAISDDRFINLPDIYYNSIILNGRENADNLGYNKGETNCQWRDVTEVVPVVEKKRRYLKSTTTNINIHFDGGLLLSNEQESFKAQFDGVDISITPINVYNSYSISGNERNGEFQLRATKRILVRPSSKSISAILMSDGDTLKLKLNDLMHDELSALFKNQMLQVNYEVMRVALINNDEAKGTVLMNSKEMEVDLKTHPTWEKTGVFTPRPKTLIKGKNYLVKINIQRLQTGTFNTERSSVTESNQVTY